MTLKRQMPLQPYLIPGLDLRSQLKQCFAPAIQGPRVQHRHGGMKTHLTQPHSMELIPTMHAVFILLGTWGFSGGALHAAANALNARAQVVHCRLEVIAQAAVLAGAMRGAGAIANTLSTRPLTGGESATPGSRTCCRCGGG